MVDDLDRRILEILLEDAHSHLRTIAEQVGTTPATIHNRIKKMEQTGVIKRFVVEVDATKVGYSISALIELDLDGDHVRKVEDELAPDPHVVSIYDITGDMDAVLVAKFANTDDLDEFIKKLLQHKHVRSTRTRLILNTVKENATPKPHATKKPS